MQENIIKVENLGYVFEDHVALKDVCFDVEKGDMVAIIGPNGSGKTTLIKNIVGIYKPTSGKVLVKGSKPYKMRKIFGYVPQKFEFDHKIPITVGEFMSLEKCKNKNHSSKNIGVALKEVGLDEEIGKKKLGYLSGGQFQRVMIARSLLHEKEILVFDEPSTGIDMVGEKTIYDLIYKINQDFGTTCIIVSHELNIVHRYAKKVLCLNQRMVCYGRGEEVINSDNLKKLYGESAGLYHSHY